MLQKESMIKHRLSVNLLSKGLTELIESPRGNSDTQVQSFPSGHHNVHNHTSAKAREETHRKGHLFNEGIIIRHHTAWTMNSLRNHRVS
jgi:hypothetical protein